MIFSLILLLICVAASQDASGNISETQPPSALTVQPTGTTDPGDASESQTTTQLITIQQTTQMDVTNNTETTTSQSTWLPQTSELTASELKFTSVDSSETFPAEENNKAYGTDLGDRGGQDVATNPGLVAVVCIFSIVVAVVVVVVIVKTVRSRRPQFERLDDVPMGKVNEGAPFARYPPK